MEVSEKANKRARSSIERYRESVGRNNKYIELNSASISNNHNDLYSDYITNILNTNYTFLTI